MKEGSEMQIIEILKEYEKGCGSGEKPSDCPECLDAAVRAIEAATKDKWQPIETAPRDGTDIIVWDGDIVTITTWGKTAHVPLYGWLQVAWADPQDVDLMYPQPTHWMPRPELLK